MNYDANELLIMLDDGETDDITKLSDLDDVIINAKLKEEGGSRKLILDGMRLSDIFKLSNAFGGYAFDDSNTHHVARLPIGNVILIEKDVLEVEVQNVLTGEDLDIKVVAIDNENTGEMTAVAYESNNTGGDSQSINDCQAVFNMEEFEGGASINDKENQYKISSREAVNVANATFDIESYIDDLGLVYTDPTSESRDISAKLPSGRYVFVRKIY
ncbi:MAG: hypothetical protein ACOCRX_05630 [Candidatus Woesearchaeota archaeon]